MGNKKAIWRASPWLPQSAALTLPRMHLPMRAIPVKKEAKAGRTFPVTFPSAKELYSNVGNCSMLFFSQPSKSVAFSFNVPCGLWCCLHPSPHTLILFHDVSIGELLIPFGPCASAPCATVASLQKTILCKSPFDLAEHNTYWLDTIQQDNMSYHDNSWLTEVVLGLHSTQEDFGRQILNLSGSSMLPGTSSDTSLNLFGGT